MTWKNDVLTHFLMYFHQKSAAVPPSQPPLPLGFTSNTNHPRGEEVWPGCGLQSSVTPVIMLIGLWSRAVESTRGGRFVVGPVLLLFLSGPLAPHRSGQVPKTGRLNSAVTHQTCNTLHVPGSSYLDLAGLSLLVRKWGPTLPHQVRDAPRDSRFIQG